MRAAARIALMASLLLGGCGVAAPTEYPAAARTAPRDAFHEIGFIDGDGLRTHVIARVCRPTSGGPWPIAVINHGGPAPGEDRATITAAGCDSPPVQWFLARGYLAILPLRRGYGASGGVWAQNPGPCASPDYVRAALEGGRDIDAVIQYAARLGYAKSDGIVVVGEGDGGWAVVGYAVRPNPHVAAIINIAGGMGGRAGDADRRTCRPDSLIAAAGEIGRTARNRMLWIYAADDPVFSPALATEMQAAFTGAGGSAELVEPASIGADAHDLLFSPVGVRVWGALVDGFLQS